MTLRIKVAQARDEALARVEAHTAPIFAEHADRIVRTLARTGREFTTDEVWKHLVGVFTHEPRALGAVITRLAKAGIIEKTGAYVPSGRIECHGRPVPVWVGTRTAKESA